MWIVKIKTWDGTDAAVQHIGPFPFRAIAEAAQRHARSLSTVTKTKLYRLDSPVDFMQYSDLLLGSRTYEVEDDSDDTATSGLAERRQALSVSRFCRVTGSSPRARISLTRFQGFLECALEGAGGEHPDYTLRDYEEDESLRHGETYARRLARELIAQRNAEHYESTDEL